jgi:hypothetical protein
MSTKIWEAYRLKRGYDFWPTLIGMQKTARSNVKRSLREVIEVMCVEHAKDPNYGPMQASAELYKKYLAQALVSEKNWFHLDTSVTIRRTAPRGSWLLIPYPGSGIVSDALKFMRKHPALSDYHYQNQSDRPTHISSREWAARARTWHPLLEDERWQEMLVLDIVSIESFWRVSPAYDMMKKGLEAFKKTLAKKAKPP